MIHKAILVATAMFSSMSASAADNRVRLVAYEADQVTVIPGRPGIQSTIQFGADERIENIGVGDSSSWQITPNRRASLLFVKPLVTGSRTNMTVVTDRRTYLFDLVGSGKDVAPLYKLKFSYPHDEPEIALAVPAPLAAPPPPTSAPPVGVEQINFGWKAKGFAKLIPTRVFDDGRSLYLSWNDTTPLPAIMTLSDDRKEGTLNYRVAGGYLVISPVPTNIVLRYGKKFATVLPSYPVQRSISPPSAVAQSDPEPVLLAKAVNPTLATPTVSESPEITGQSGPTIKLAAARIEQPLSLSKLALPTNLYTDTLAGNDDEAR